MPLRRLIALTTLILLITAGAHDAHAQRDVPVAWPPTPSANQLSQRMCTTSAWCHLYGYCSYAAGTCLARTDVDCGRSASCRDHGRCRARSGRCEQVPTVSSDPAMTVVGGVFIGAGALALLLTAPLWSITDGELVGEVGASPALYTLVAGVSLVALGIPLVAIGSRPVPDASAQASLRLGLGAGTIGLEGSF